MAKREHEVESPDRLASLLIEIYSLIIGEPIN